MHMSNTVCQKYQDLVLHPIACCSMHASNACLAILIYKTQTQREHRQITAISCIPYHILFFLLKIWGSDCDRYSQSSPSCMQQNKLYKGRCSWYINRQRMQSGTQHFFFIQFMDNGMDSWHRRVTTGDIGCR